MQLPAQNSLCHLYHANFNPIVYFKYVLLDINVLCDYTTHVTTPYSMSY